MESNTSSKMSSSNLLGYLPSRKLSSCKFRVLTCSEHHPPITHVFLDNCSDPHYNMRINLGNEDMLIHTYNFRNFISAKSILEGEIKNNISIQIENFMGSL